MSLPWGALLAAAARLGIPPAAFWRLSLREWRLLADAETPAMRPEDLRELAAKFPDSNFPNREPGDGGQS